MGLLQRAAETYDNMSHLVGIQQDEKTVLAPIGFITTSADIEITVDISGNYISSKKIEEKVLIPVTEESAGRTSSPCAHPLCDQLSYLSGTDETKFELYINQLEKWCKSQYCNEKAIAVLEYVKKKTLAHDISQAGLLSKDDNGNTDFQKHAKDFIVWRVLGGREPDAVWKDTLLMKQYSEYYCTELSVKQKRLCYVSGKNNVIASQHMKGVMSLNGNAKLISANDKQNFTFLGRFLDDKETSEVSFEISQKAHNALKWIISNHGVTEGSRAFVCWNPKGKKAPKPTYPFYSDEEELPKPSNYRTVLKKILEGYKNQFTSEDQIVVASFDAATTGRLSVTYYNEFGAFDFLDKMKLWDETCCFAYSNKRVSSPYLKTIVNVAFGTQRGEGDNAKFDVDKKFSSGQLQRLIACRLECSPFPTDIMRAAVQKCSSLNTLTESNRQRALFTTCAIIKKYRFDHFKEEWSMALEKDRKDRSYQYGRLLAVLEKIEISTYDEDTKRESNAIRMQSMFIKRPGYTSAIIQERLKTGYYPKLSTGQKVYFEKLMGEIIEMISMCGEDDFNKPLGETYLLGYYLQKNAFYTKKTDEQVEYESE